MPYRFTVATRPEQLGQIHALNHHTFAGEIPQHAPRADGVLVDRFDPENTYLVALDGETVVGMMAMRDRRPFSLDAKLDDLDAALPPGRCVEVRLLAVRPERRHGRVFFGLMGFAARWMVHRGYDAAVISGSTERLGLYERMGFHAFGPRVGHDGAWYQPMMCTLADAVRGLPAILPPPETTVSLLPGPVELSPSVREAFARPPVSHRSDAFGTMHGRVLDRLRALTGARHVALLSGTGTLANDVVAAHLASWGTPGIVLSHGEFGERLEDHARRHRLPHTVVRAPWGEAPGYNALDERLRTERPAWLWTVHGETSTGVLIDLPRLADLAAAHGTRLVLDAVSTVGAVPLDLRNVLMTSGVGGKALGAPAGLAFVAHAELPPAATPVPRALDLSLYAAADGIPFTISSPLVAALDAALSEATPERMTRLHRQGLSVRRHLEAHGLELVAPTADALPTVQTVALGDAASAVGARLDALGFQTSYRSGYLRARGWLQLCTMGAQTDEQVEAAAAVLCAAVDVERGG